MPKHWPRISDFVPFTMVRCSPCALFQTRSSPTIALGFEEADAVLHQSGGHSSNLARPVVISVLGHVDHGKTTLLDALSDSHVAEYEPGRITQAVSAFLARLRPPKPAAEVNASPYTTLLTNLLEKSGDGGQVTSEDVATLLDTPGHSAFFKMREGGASVSDFVMLVIAADEGIKEQTVESIKLLTSLRVPMLVAINKVDIAKPDQIEKIYGQMKKMQLCVPKLTRKSNPLLMSPPDTKCEPFCVLARFSI
jgi:small GTP-binding protein